MKTSYELYGAPTGNCIRAAIALEEAGLPYAVRPVDLASGEHRSAAYLALNPAGKVPVLIERQQNVPPVVIAQSNAIILYAAERPPGRLLPDDSLARSVVYERFFFFVTDVIAVSHAAFFLRGAGVPAGQTLLVERMLAALESAERYVSDDAYMAGKTFSIADIAAFTITQSVKSQLPWARLPNLRRWYEQVEARPALARGLKAFDPG
ncbi:MULTISPECIES: glutathione S-transferase family protein [Paraburkholderia]|uniref:glutathione S-transferase family protein n=1 Tax=Paraburkholderia TaxID=1822464 RepID=UPI0006D3C8BD|nr:MULTISPECIES: glutathione S-transferase family protein [Paraburkholderia]MDR6382777.1 GST-like protein [Paraburkholderia caribensis]